MHPLSASAGVDRVQFMADHGDSPLVVEAQGPGAGRRANVPSCGQDMDDAV
jgi:hypothetical protein